MQVRIHSHSDANVYAHCANEFAPTVFVASHGELCPQGLKIDKLIHETKPGNNERINRALSLLKSIGITTNINLVVGRESILMRAVKLGDKNTALLLVLAGAHNKQTYFTKSGGSASDMARANNHNELADLIEEHSI